MGTEASRCNRCRGWILSHETHCATCGPEPAPPSPTNVPFAQARLDVPPSSPGIPAAAPAPFPAPSSLDDDPLDDPLEPSMDEAHGLQIDEDALLGGAPPSHGPRSGTRRSDPEHAPSPPSLDRDGEENPPPISRNEEPPLPDEEVRRVAALGPAPDGWLAAVFYAVRVLQRYKELGAELTSCQEASRAARQVAEHALLEWADALIQHVDALDEERRAHLAPWLAAHDRALRAVQRAEGQRGEEAQALRTRIEQLRRDIEQAEHETHPIRNEEARAQARIRLAEGELRDIEGHVRRIEIELRNLRAMPAPDAARITELEAALQARRAEGAVASRKLAEARETLAPISLRLAERLQEVQRLQETLSRTEWALRDVTEEHDAALEAHHAALREAKLRLGEAALVLEPPEALQSAHERATRAWRIWLARRRRERLVEAARSSWDRTAVYRGLALLGASALLVLVALLVAILR